MQGGPLEGFLEESAREAFCSKLSGLENWLYEVSSTHSLTGLMRIVSRFFSRVAIVYECTHSSVIPLLTMFAHSSRLVLTVVFSLMQDGEDEEKSVYLAKLKEIKDVGDAAEMRFKEAETRPKAIEDFQTSLLRCRKFLNEREEGAEKYAHIPEDKVKKAADALAAKEQVRASNSSYFIIV